MASFPGSVTPGNGTLVDLSDFWTAARANLLNDELIAVEMAGLRMHFGDGSDGAVDMDGVNTFAAFATLSESTYTLIRDIYPSALTVRAGVTLKTSGFKVFCAGIVTIEATGAISNSGEDGSNASGTTGGTAGASGGGGSTKTPPAAKDGANGYDAGSTGASEPISAGGLNGLNGGIGGAFPGGFGGTATALPVADGGIRNLTTLALWRAFSASAVVSFGYHAGNGGAGAGNADEGSPGAGGGGGGNGGYLVIFAPVISNDGSIQAIGGDGGNGSNATGDGSGGGGGTGGNGGLIAIACLVYSGNTPVVAGGTGGDGGTGGPSGQSGLTGYDGLVIELKPA
ncbi:MAG: hypothetical protein JXR84_15360 [Anaerolineae bacterium]|nr:hypothetical protein [Anaerolineae bacterium]